MKIIASLMFILFIALSIDNFLITNKKGATLRDLSFSKTLIYALLFTFGNVIAMVLALLVANLFENSLGFGLEIALVIILLVLLGFIYMAEFFIGSKFQERLDKDFNNTKCFKLSLFTSFDSFLIGIVLALIDIPYGMIILMSATYTFISSILGLRFGYSYGVNFQGVLILIAGIICLIFALLIGIYLIV